MRRLVLQIGFILGFLAMIAPGVVVAESQGEGDVKEAVQREITKRTKYTGRLDLYDDANSKVRHLDLIKFDLDIRQDGDNKVATLKYKDIDNGDMVDVNFFVVSKNNVFRVKRVKILKVEEKTIKKVVKPEKKNYGPDEVREFVVDYLAQQTKLLEYFALFDQNILKVRKLEIIEIDEEARNFGSISIVGVVCKDLATNESVRLDITVSSRNSDLSVSKIKIKEVPKK